MNARALTIALAVSVAVNLFAAATGVTLLVQMNRQAERAADQARPARDMPIGSVLRDLDSVVRDQVRASRRQSALAARPDFMEARRKRREAVELAASDRFDKASVQALLAQSRAAELRGRARLEADALTLLETLEPADRRIVAQTLSGRGPRERNGRRGASGQDLRG